MDNRNYFIAIALSVLVLVAWQFLYVNPKLEAERARLAAIEAQQPTNSADPAAGASSGDLPAASRNIAPDGALPGDGVASQTDATATGESTVDQSARITIDTPSLIGSLNLTGARLDDLRLKKYRETVDPQSPLITLFSPASQQRGFFTEFGYIGDAASGSVPGPETVWQVKAGDVLTPATPVTLSYTNETGLTFERTITVDEDYLFSYEDSVLNNGDQAVSLSPYGRVTRFYKPSTPSIYVLHEGLIGYLGEEGLQEIDYSTVEEDGILAEGQVDSGWLGITDKYWATALIPAAGQAFEPRFAYFSDGRPRYQADFRSVAITVPAGDTATVINRAFAGAKLVPVIDAYETAYEIPRFELMIDWGWFYFITKPLFHVLEFFFQVFGNFGVAILATTVLVKLIFFPLANKSYVSMANMKKLQPKLEELKAKHGDDRMAMQQAMMELYKTEKVNPIAGCWPVLLQIPVFFALYKVLYVTIEMRHAPFFGWIRDLSAPDPTSIFNLFGLLPYDVPSFLMVGVWPLIMGLTMFLQMRMNPTPPDPTQAMIFTWLPVVFTFMMATFPAGLIIYWAWNNFLSILQQGIIMKRQGAKIELWDNLTALFKRKKPDPAE